MWTACDPKGQFSSPYTYAGNGTNVVIYVDKDGNFFFIPFLIAAAVGGIINVGLDYGMSKISGQPYDWRDGLVSFGVGFATSALGPSAPFLKGLAPVYKYGVSILAQSTVSAFGSQARASWIHKSEKFTLANFGMRLGTDVVARGVFLGVSKGFDIKGINPYADNLNQALGGNARNLLTSTANTFARKMGSQYLPSIYPQRQQEEPTPTTPQQTPDYGGDYPEDGPIWVPPWDGKFQPPNEKGYDENGNPYL
jgi:hypothetical protein